MPKLHLGRVEILRVLSKQVPVIRPHIMWSGWFGKWHSVGVPATATRCGWEDFTFAAARIGTMHLLRILWPIDPLLGIALCAEHYNAQFCTVYTREQQVCPNYTTEQQSCLNFTREHCPALFLWQNNSSGLFATSTTVPLRWPACPSHSEGSYCLLWLPALKKSIHQYFYFWLKWSYPAWLKTVKLFKVNI